MSVVKLLRQNDPTRSSIRICLRDEQDDGLLAQALEQNGFITRLSVDLTDRNNTARTHRQWPELLRVISTREQLEKVRIWSSVAFSERNSTLIARPFVLAIQQNSNIRSVDFSLALSGPVLISFLDQATQIKTLELLTRIAEFTPQDTREVALALQRNTNIESLTFGKFEADFLLPILDSLASNAFLKHLAVSWRTRHTESLGLALQRLLEATTSIRCFELLTLIFYEANNERLHHICQGLLNSRVVTDMKFKVCAFLMEESLNQLKNLLQSKENLRSLSIINCFFGNSQQLQEMLVACLQRKSSPLQCLELDMDSRFYTSFLRRDSFNTFLHAVAKSKLERFMIGAISSQQELESLTNIIPAMKVEDFEITVVSSLNNRTTKDALLEAIGDNFCLRTVVGKVKSDNSIDRDRADLFGEVDKQRLKFYAERNQLVVEWVENPITVHRDVWPEALTLTERAGPDTLFQSLRALSGSGIGLTHGKRKRKRAAEPA